MDQIPDAAINHGAKFIEYLGWSLVPQKMQKALENKATAETNTAINSQAIIEQAIRDGRIKCSPGTSPDVVTRIMNDEGLRIINQRLRSIEIAIQAYTMLPESVTQSLPALRPEFTERLLQYSGEVIDEEAQKLWAKLLAEEVQQPGSISLRTLSILRDMSSEEAKTLKKYSNYTLFGICFLKDINTFSTPEELNKDFNILYGAGLIEFRQMSSSFELEPGEEITYETFNGIATLKNTGDSSVLFNGCPLTRAGSELVRLDSLPPDFDAILDTLPKSISKSDIKYGYQQKNER